MKIDLLKIPYAAGLVAASISLGSYAYRVVNEPPYQYLSSQYAASKSLVCPGESFTYAPSLRITHAPVIVKSYGTVWDVVNKRTAIPDVEGNGKVYIWTTPNIVITSLSTYKVPDTLKPGDYEIRRSLSSETRSVSAMSIPFKVSSNCSDILKK